ncbi:hypothetical protein [Synechocystis sp. PCC 7509]|uniref:hypothetical protein n=1 Tax=Synechocystis sp. PCC 7509 TaxID=927677 RepID=UPI0002AC33E7|nr:hypothetical protein [Synechocystis sp. PCC 7509]
MRQISTTAFLGMLALTITGCPSSNTQQSSPVPSPSTAPVVVTTPPVKPPLVASDPSSAANLAPGLIQPTNANQRAKQVAKGNRDPFTALFLPVPAPPISVGGNSSNAPAQTPQTGSSPRNINSGQSRPNVTINVNNPRTAPGSRTAPNQNNLRNGTTTSIQNIPVPPNTAQPNNSLEPVLPVQQEPDLAESVMVMGVIQIGEQTQAIVQVPSEATSRYVQVGQTLSNGQVLVKRIELNAGAEPLVILEQYGVEVSKAVGEQAPSQAQQTTPAAAVPYLPPQNASTASVELPAPPPNINTPQANISLPTLSLPNIPVAAR